MNLDEKLYLVAKNIFKNKTEVSVGKIQLYLQISYHQARLILDQMIEEEFCEKQVSARPCKVFKIKIIN